MCFRFVDLSNLLQMRLRSRRGLAKITKRDQVAAVVAKSGTVTGGEGVVVVVLLVVVVEVVVGTLILGNVL